MKESPSKTINPDIQTKKGVTATCVKSILTTICGRTGGALIATINAKTGRRLEYYFTPCLSNLSVRQAALNEFNSWINKAGTGLLQKYDIAWFEARATECRATLVMPDLFTPGAANRLFGEVPSPVKKDAK